MAIKRLTRLDTLFLKTPYDTQVQMAVISAVGTLEILEIVPGYIFNIITYNL